MRDSSLPPDDDPRMQRAIDLLGRYLAEHEEIDEVSFRELLQRAPDLREILEVLREEYGLFRRHLPEIRRQLRARATQRSRHR